MWLRQEVEQKRIQHESFVKQLGLEDIRSLIAPRENEEEEKGVKLSAWN